MLLLQMLFRHVCHLGIFASINQRIDAETITIIADEFGFGVEFISAEDQIGVEEEEILMQMKI